MLQREWGDKMKVLMLGNGFDINYKLLTKYINFLNIANHISTTALTDIKTVGDILGSEKLQKVDQDVARSYQEYKRAYDATLLEESMLRKLSELANNNLLFLFLFKSFNRDVGWIDFEKEISVVLQAFRHFLEQERPVYDAAKFPESALDRFIIAQFSFFHQSANPGLHNNSTRQVTDEYIIEYPYGSTLKIIHKEKIIETLEKQMLDLADGLRIYLKCFVENVVIEMCKLKCLHTLPAITGASHVVTFNYTDTYERLYSSERVYHIHGSTKDRIILGINPDEADEVSTIDVSFLRFKKYFQRVICHSDDNYLKWVRQNHANAALVVMGHSLDVTDKDVIMQMFDMAKDITVLYYSENAEASMVANLIKIYGKEKFDELRIKKRLRFLPQDASYKGFAEDRQSKEMSAFVSAMGNPMVF